MIASASSIDALRPSGSACRGAAFTTYAFDAVFFEEELLPAVLGIESDPTTDLRRFLDEGRRRVQSCPVMVLTDATGNFGAHRLPHDLLFAPQGRTLHAKIALTIFDEQARLIVGSGNLTQGGHGGNAELSVLLELDYARDASILAEVMAFFEGAGAHGEAWRRIGDEVALRTHPDAQTTSRAADLAFLHSLEAPLLTQFLQRIPVGATVTRAAVLAPFHQEDGAPPEFGVFDRMLDALLPRAARGFSLDIGLPWSGNPLAPPALAEACESVAEGQLWGIVEGKPESTRWAAIGERDGHGHRMRAGDVPWRSTRSMNQAIGEKRAWLVDRIVATGPARLVARAAERTKVTAWVRPENERVEGVVTRRPLHAKLLCVLTKEDGRKRTHLLVGSPNASARALILHGGNVETAIHLVLDGHHALDALAPGFVPVPTDVLELQVTEFPAVEANPAAWIESAVFDARRDCLRIELREGAPRVQVTYPPRGPEPLPTSEDIAPFELSPARADLDVRLQGAEGRFPITVVHVAELATEGADRELTLEEILALHAGRLGTSGTAQVSAGGGAGTDAFGASGTALLELEPRDVFRALLAMGEEMRDPALSLGALEVLADGRSGVRVLARRLVDAGRHGGAAGAEAWIFLLELAKAIDMAPDTSSPLAGERTRRAAELAREIRAMARELTPRTSWAGRVAAFHGVAP